MSLLGVHFNLSNTIYVPKYFMLGQHRDATLSNAKLAIKCTLVNLSFVPSYGNLLKLLSFATPPSTKGRPVQPRKAS